ncbi:MAG: hypothetical protein K9K86_02910 [Pseudomonadales bacterium]|nr:hypothetical protein [Pseudomonadales bacterium]
MYLYRRYWAFYWPLALTACFLLLGLQIFNAVLARYPNAERELAVFAYAISFIHFLEVAMAFMPQMVMVYARNRKARRRVKRFCLSTGLLFSAFACFLGTTALGRQWVSTVYGIEGAVLTEVSRYLSYLFPTILLRTQFHFFAGLLTQNDQTRWVSVCAFLGVGLGVIVCLYGYHADWPAFATLVAAQLSASVGMAVCAVFAYYRFYTPVDEPGFVEPQYLDLFRYFWPVSFTGMSFGLGRPLIYAFVSRTPDALFTIAALRVGLDFFMISQMALNQFRSLLPSLGLDNLREKRFFIGMVTTAFMLVMASVIFTPLDQIVFKSWLGLSDLLYIHVKQTLMVVLLTPPILAVRNYFHGLLLVHKKTQGIALGSAFRVTTVLLCCWLFLTLGWLNSWTAPLVMVIGFSVETIVVFIIMKRASVNDAMPPINLELGD